MPGIPADPQPRRRWQFRLSHLLLLILLVAIAVRQLISPMWLPAERWLLASWLVGWTGGFTYGRWRGNRGFLTSTVAATLLGSTVALVLYTVDPPTAFGYRYDVVYPLVALFVLASFSSVAVSFCGHVLLFVIASLRSVLPGDKKRWRAVRNQMMVIACVLVLAVFLGRLWYASNTWQPMATRDIGHIEVGSVTVAFSPDHSLLAVGHTQDNVIEVYERSTLQRVSRFEVTPDHHVPLVQFSSDGSSLLYGGFGDNAIRQIEVTSGKQAGTPLNLPESPVEFYQDRESDALYVVSHSDTNHLSVSYGDIESGSRQDLFRLADRGYWPIVHVEQGLFAYLRFTEKNSIDPPTILSLHRLSDGEHLTDGPRFGVVFGLCFSREGDWICAGKTLWNHGTGETFEIPYTGVAFLPNQRVLMLQSVQPHNFIRDRIGSLTAIWLIRTPLFRRALVYATSMRLLIYDIPRRAVIQQKSFQGFVRVWVRSDGKEMVTNAGNKMQLWKLP